MVCETYGFLDSSPKYILILSTLFIGGLACGFEVIYEIKQGGK